MTEKPLMDAYRARLLAGDSSVVHELLHAGIDLNAVGSTGFTPLMLAANAGRSDLALCLLANGALVNGRGYQGMTALHEAASEGHVDTARALLDANAAVNAVTDDGFTPLMGAAAAGNVEVASLLLDYGANADLREYMYNTTAMDIASEKGQGMVVELLRDWLRKDV